MNTAKTLLAATAIASCTTLASATPVVSGVSMSQSDTSRRVTISYTLSEQAVITLDIQTNDTQGVWVSIGGEAISGHVSGKTSGPAQGDVWKKVAAGTHTITWRPDYMWPDHVIGEGGARAVVTAWALDNPPDYMVADLADATVRYYPGADFLPGGLLANEDYRKTKLVLRKIMAKDIEWTKGGNSTETGWKVIDAIPGEPQYTAQLTNNYYIGVFEVTQTQYDQLKGSNLQNNSKFNNIDYKAMRPVDSVSYNWLRGTDVNYPAPPSDASIFGHLRTMFDGAYAFDLPSEAQWEFAARAGHGLGCWNDGSPILASTTEDTNLSRMARYLQNSGNSSNYTFSAAAECTADNGTAICGSYEPNSWGLYDMEGNMLEWCLDWFTTDTSTLQTLKGAVNTTKQGSYGRVMKGGSFVHDPWRSRPGFRWHGDPSDSRIMTFGFRVALGL